MAPPSRELLLIQHLTALQTSRVPINMRLPSRRAEVAEATWGRVVEDLLDFLEGLLAGLGEEEEDVDEHGGAEDAETRCTPPSECLRMLGA